MQMDKKTSAATDPERISLQKTILFSAITAILLLLFAELCTRGGLYLLSSFYHSKYNPIDVSTVSDSDRTRIQAFIAHKTEYMIHHPVLGWSLAANSGAANDQSGSPDQLRTNTLGIRSLREYTPKPLAGRIRVAAFGDSFTHGDGVANDQTWEAKLEALDSRFEVLNFGVPGYGPDQAYLRYQLEGKQVNPHIVIIGVMSENIYRIVNRYRSFYMPRTGLPLAKPRFVMEGRTMHLLPNPLPTLASYQQLLDNPGEVLPRLGVNDFHYMTAYTAGQFDFLATVRLSKMALSRYSEREQIKNLDGTYNTNSEAFILLVELLSNFYDEVIRDGAVPVVLVFPNTTDMNRLLRGKPVAYAPLTSSLKHKGMTTIDGMSAFESALNDESLRELIKGHYTARGNEVIAQHLLTALPWASVASE